MCVSIHFTVPFLQATKGQKERYITWHVSYGGKWQVYFLLYVLCVYSKHASFETQDRDIEISNSGCIGRSCIHA